MFKIIHPANQMSKLGTSACSNLFSIIGKDELIENAPRALTDGNNTSTISCILTLTLSWVLAPISIPIPVCQISIPMQTYKNPLGWSQNCLSKVKKMTYFRQIPHFANGLSKLDPPTFITETYTQSANNFASNVKTILILLRLTCPIVFVMPSDFFSKQLFNNGISTNAISRLQT